MHAVAATVATQGPSQSWKTSSYPLGLLGVPFTLIFTFAFNRDWLIIMKGLILLRNCRVKLGVCYHPDNVATHYFSPSQKLEHGCARDKLGMGKPFIQGISSLVMVLHILLVWRE